LLKFSLAQYHVWLMSQGLSDNQTTALILPFLPGSRSASFFVLQKFPYEKQYISCCFLVHFFKKSSEVVFVGNRGLLDISTTETKDTWSTGSSSTMNVFAYIFNCLKSIRRGNGLWMCFVFQATATVCNCEELRNPVDGWCVR
jgi:hypothetical protein